MNKIESINYVQAYEINGSDISSGLRSERPKITVREHWNRKDFVVVTIGDTSLTVVGRDLKAAIENAQNC